MSTDDYKQTKILKFNLQSRALQNEFKDLIRVQQEAEFKQKLSLKTTLSTKSWERHIEPTDVNPG